MTDSYDPVSVESAWYDWWHSKGLFAPQMTPGGKPKPDGLFVIPLPPPTINGGLHIGHALTVTLEDVLTRWYVPLVSRYIHRSIYRLGIGCWARPLCLFQDLIMVGYRRRLWSRNGYTRRQVRLDIVLDAKSSFKRLKNGKSSKSLIFFVFRGTSLECVHTVTRN
jgi:hypothetical protein